MKLIYEVFDLVKSSKNVDDKINVLRKNETWALKDVLRGTYDPKVKWNVPTGKPPYEPNQGHNAPANLLKQNKQFKYFVTEQVPTTKREALWIGLLEGIPKEEAELLDLLKDGVWAFPNITKEIAVSAFPEISR